MAPPLGRFQVPEPADPELNFPFKIAMFGLSAFPETNPGAAPPTYHPPTLQVGCDLPHKKPARNSFRKSCRGWGQHTGRKQVAQALTQKRTLNRVCSVRFGFVCLLWRPVNGSHMQQPKAMHMKRCTVQLDSSRCCQVQHIHHKACNETISKVRQVLDAHTTYALAYKYRIHRHKTNR